MLSCRPRGGGVGGCCCHISGISLPHQIHDKYSMTHGFMGNSGFCFPELDGRWAWRSNVIQILKSASLHQHPLGIHPLISKTVDASVSKWSLQNTPLLTGKSTLQDQSRFTQQERWRCYCILSKLKFKVIFWYCSLVALFVCTVCLRVKCYCSLCLLLQLLKSLSDSVINKADYFTLPTITFLSELGTCAKHTGCGEFVWMPV